MILHWDQVKYSSLVFSSSLVGLKAAAHVAVRLSVVDTVNLKPYNNNNYMYCSKDTKPKGRCLNHQDICIASLEGMM